MIRILSPQEIQEIEQEYPMLDPKDVEFDIVYHSTASNINIPDCFTEQIFKNLYGVNIDQVKFVDNNRLNWKFDNIIFRG